ncbi:ejaculatory bulb-specific protein 3 [Planococcus citri]|uniref:ejaculatory bulb-specific protein 3 n=1 Tax=Planococcus citri TaxID=170843 RepID=UPI0031F95431
MNFSIYILVIFATLVSVCWCEKNADLDTLLADKNFVRKQISCVLGKGRCDKFGTNLKASLPKVIGQNCESCSPEEATNAKKIIGFVKQNYPEVWNKVAQRYSGK